jgi:hypothetical protein
LFFQQIPPLRVHTLIRQSAASRAWPCNLAWMKPLELANMNLRRLMTASTLRRTAVLPSGVVVWLLAFGSAGIENIGAAPIVSRVAPALAANAALPEPVQPVTLRDADVENVDVLMDGSLPTGIAADTTLTSRESETHETETIVTASLTDPTDLLPAETPAAQAAIAGTPVPESGNARPVVGSVEILDECFSMDVCIDRYLWALYQRTLKEDTIKVQDRKKVTVKRKGRMVTVTKTFTTVVNEDFAWKDPKAAEKANMSMMTYVIGGMDPTFKLKLFHALLAAEQAGLSPGITSAFRDDYRQSIASGLKAATDRSYHGGSFRGGYGHGLAADVVSTAGATHAQRWVSNEIFWKWIDAHGKEYGIGRPYLDRDPPHVAPIDGKEYANHTGGTKARHAASDVKKRKHVAGRDDRKAAKRVRIARSS